MTNKTKAREYKLAAKGSKQFKKDHPEGKVFVGSPQKQSTDESEIIELITLREIVFTKGAKHYLPLMEKYKDFFSKYENAFLKEIFTAQSEKANFYNPFALRYALPDAKHRLFNEGVWQGDSSDRIEFLNLLLEQSTFDNQTILKIVKAQGYDYTIRQIQREKEKRTTKYKNKLNRK